MRQDASLIVTDNFQMIENVVHHDAIFPTVYIRHEAFKTSNFKYDFLRHLRSITLL